MLAKRSEDFYFPGGDLVLQIEGTLFRIHRDLIAMYSEFFRDMFSTPTSNEKEGTSDEHPLHLPNELCRTAETFKTLCRFIYPKRLGALPEVLVHDIEAWELVLDAALALQMADVREHVISGFMRNTPAIGSEAVRLLTWAMRPEIECDDLKLGCIRAIVYRRLSISPSEAAILGTKLTCQLMLVRERVRTVLSSRAKSITIPGICCASRSECENKIFKAIINNMTMDWAENSSQSKLDVFQINNVPSCSACPPNKVNLARSLMHSTGVLENEIRRCAGVVGLCV